MVCIQPRFIKEVNAYGLDSCGRMITATPAAVFVIDTTEIEMTRLIEEGTRNEIKNTNGELCYNPKPCSTDRGFDIRTQICGSNLAFSAITGDADALLSLGNITGLNYSGVDCSAAFALELIYRLETPSCDGAGDPQCWAQFFPMVTATRTDGSMTANSEDLMQDNYIFTTYKNPRVFIDPTTNVWTVPASLAHWGTTYATELQTGTFGLKALIDCPAARTPSCELVTVA